MKKNRLLVSFMIMCMTLGTTAFGMDTNKDPEILASATLVNNETGEIIELPMTLIESKKISPQTRSVNGVETIERTYKAGVTVPENNDGVMPLMSNQWHDGTYSYIGDVSITFDRYYDSAKKDYALVLKEFTGSWTKKDSAVSISKQKYSYACNNAGLAKKQAVVEKSFYGSISTKTGFTIPVYEEESTSICGGEILGTFSRTLGSSWQGRVTCYAVNK